MKKLLLFFCFSSISGCFALNQSLINAIVNSDYEAFNSIFKQTESTDKEISDYLKIVDQNIEMHSRWAAVHTSWHPQLGKDLLVMFPAWGFGSLLSLAAPSLFLKKDEAGEDVIRHKIFIVPMLALMGIGITCGYYAIKSFINAFRRPRMLFENDLKIKAALLEAQK